MVDGWDVAAVSLEKAFERYDLRQPTKREGLDLHNHPPRRRDGGHSAGPVGADSRAERQPRVGAATRRHCQAVQHCGCAGHVPRCASAPLPCAGCRRRRPAHHRRPWCPWCPWRPCAWAVRARCWLQVDVGGVAWLEHINMVFGDKTLAEMFYFAGLGASPLQWWRPLPVAVADPHCRCGVAWAPAATGITVGQHTLPVASQPAPACRCRCRRALPQAQVPHANRCGWARWVPRQRHPDG